MKFKQVIIILFLFIFLIFSSAISYTRAVCSNIQNSVFRLHIISNSDSKEDQNLKYQIRNNIIEFLNNSNINASSKSDVIQFVQNNLGKIKNIAEKTIQDYGFNYPVNISVGTFPFPSKKYSDITLPPRLL